MLQLSLFIRQECTVEPRKVIEVAGRKILQLGLDCDLGVKEYFLTVLCFQRPLSLQ